MESVTTSKSEAEEVGCPQTEMGVFFHCSILKAKGATFSWGPHDYSLLAILELDMGLSHLLSGYRSRVERASPDSIARAIHTGLGT